MMTQRQSFPSDEVVENDHLSISGVTAGSRRTATAEELRAEFDEWARAGWAADLELNNRYLMEVAVKLLSLKPGARVLDLSCGTGLATRMIADRIAAKHTFGRVTGVDISPGMLELARKASGNADNVSFLQGSADAIPGPDEQFDEVVCIESFYYYPDQGRALNELYRVMAPEGRLYLILRLYSDNPHADEFLSHLSVPAHVRSMAEYVQMLTERGFRNVQATRLPEPRRRRGGVTGVLRRGLRLFALRPRAWLPEAAERLRVARKRDKAKAIGALLLSATRP